VTFSRRSVYDLAEMSTRFDIVLLLGVLYHLRYPLLALDLVAERVAGTLVLQTLTMPGSAPLSPPEDLAFGERDRLLDDGWPRAAFVERRLAGDPTNWWVADDACVQAMARSAGLRVTATPGHEIYVWERDEAEDDVTRQLRDAELRAVTRYASQRK